MFPELPLIFRKGSWKFGVDYLLFLTPYKKISEVSTSLKRASSPWTIAWLYLRYVPLLKVLGILTNNHNHRRQSGRVNFFFLKKNWTWHHPRGGEIH